MPSVRTEMEGPEIEDSSGVDGWAYYKSFVPRITLSSVHVLPNQASFPFCQAKNRIQEFH